MCTLCSTDGLPNGRSLTIPAFSNICRSADHPDLLPLSCVDNLLIIFSAICHNMPEEDMKLCPYKGKVLSQNPFQAGSQVYLDLVIFKNKKTSSMMDSIIIIFSYSSLLQAPAADPGHNQPRQFSTGFNFGRFVQK